MHWCLAVAAAAPPALDVAGVAVNLSLPKPQQSRGSSRAPVPKLEGKIAGCGAAFAAKRALAGVWEAGPAHQSEEQFHCGVAAGGAVTV